MDETCPADWRPTASFDNLRRRAQVLAAIRAFFAARGVLEVETPALCGAGTTDPALASLTTRYTGPGLPAGTRLFLQTSPEFAMKRLLAAGSGSIYQICKAFRDHERGGRHNPEFTLLEWYRIGFDHWQLMDEVEALLAAVLGNDPGPAPRWSYRELFLHHVATDPLTCAVPALAEGAVRLGVSVPAGMPDDDPDPWRDLLWTQVVEPRLPPGPAFVYDYPASQAALARVRADDPPVAERFELYLDGVELANGFHELSDPAEQRARFDRDAARRSAAGLEPVPADGHLLAALDHGLPDCAGVALGLDRLVMAAAAAPSIDAVVAFPVERA